MIFVSKKINCTQEYNQELFGMYHKIDLSNFSNENCYAELNPNHYIPPPKQYVSLKEIECGGTVPPTTKVVDHTNEVNQVSQDPRVDYFLNDQIRSQVPVNGNNLFKPNKKKIPNKIKFLCDYPGCMKPFKDNNHLQIHQRKHTGEKPFTCDYQGCERRFSQKNNLKTHQRIHNDEKPYECEVCHKKFRQPTNLNVHHKKSHPFLMR
ncbi:hypothetical protein RclHR1_02330018 [Rhizophagus clarus]|uniref:C2H2-type domain-containing protein n=1 Tax=Rhizophagus clarus TaxID=94130 RepID=A0A2Z6QWE8_9GLOM|nr:hypothetical protein RclHR1_02330018 [Rhizophagus clarus]